MSVAWLASFVAVSPETVTGWLAAATAACGGGVAVYRKGVKPAVGAVSGYFSRFARVCTDVENITKEVRTNGGGSLKDLVLATNQKVGALEQSVAMMNATQNTLAAASRTALFRAHPDGTFSWVNDTFSRTTGISGGEALGWGWVNAVHPDDRDCAIDDWMDATAHARAFRSEFRLKHVTTGAVARVRCEAHPIMLGVTVVVGYVGSAAIVDDREPAYDRRHDSGAAAFSPAPFPNTPTGHNT